MKDTKRNIARAALHLFNQQGFVNVRLQHIADEANVSVGNLAYHFESKQLILMKLYEEIVRKQEALLRHLNVVPLFEHLDHHWQEAHQLQQQYSFFYIDTLELLRSNEQLAQKHRTHIYWEVQQYASMLNFNISRGVIASNSTHEEIVVLANQLWMTENSWLHQAAIRDQDDVSSQRFREQLWALLLPNMTPMGLQEYKQLIKLRKITL